MNKNTKTIFAFLLLLVLIGSYLYISPFSLVSQSNVQLKDGKKYIVSNVLFNKPSEELVLIKKDSKIENYIAGNEIKLSYGGLTSYNEMQFVEGVRLQCNDIIGKKDLGIDYYVPQASATLVVNGNIELITNGILKANKNIKITNLDTVIPLTNGAFLEVLGLSLKDVPQKPDPDVIGVMIDRNDGNKVYIIKKDIFNSNLKNIGFLTSALAQIINPLTALSSGQLQCPFGLGYTEIRNSMLSSKQTINDYGATKFVFDDSSNKMRWYYDINKVSLSTNVWVSEDIANLVLYNPKEGNPQIISFNLNPISASTEQTIIVKNAGENEGNFILTLAPEEGILISQNTFSFVLKPQETKTIKFKTFLSQQNKNVCIKATLSSFSKVAEAKSCTQTKAEKPIEGIIELEQSNATKTGTPCKEGFIAKETTTSSYGGLFSETKITCVPEEKPIDWNVIAFAGIIAITLLGGVYLFAQRGRKK